MAPCKVSLSLLALTVLSIAAAVHGCSTCPTPTPPVVPTPPPVVPAPPPVVPTPPPSGGGGGGGGGSSCPIDVLKLSACANVLNLLNLNIPGLSSNDQCCPLLQGLADLDAAVCLCTAIKANVLGINLNVPVDLTLLLNHCDKTCPADFTCPA